jgi:Asp-tRNA(Asn)/Glu-tRNA(Gln) amidotransferase A subunit family amidase
MTDFLWKSALELRELVKTKKASPVEVTKASLTRLREVEPAINAFVEVTEDQALDAARNAEKAVMAGEPVGALAGLPVSVKDLIAVKGAKLTFGSRAMAENVAAVDAPSVERVRASHGVIIGKTTTSEFGCKGVGSSPLTGITRNPWDLSKTPGGSSCGAAASIAAGVSPFGLGTDGGGSVRVPCSLTGLFGIKGHFGRVPVWPTSATPTLAHVGPLARTVRDAALLLGVISGYDARDAGAVSQTVPDFLTECDMPAKGMRLAWSPTLGYAKPKPEVLAIAENAAKTFEDLGCSVEIVEKVFDEDPLPQFMAEFFAGAGTRLKPVLMERRELLDPAVARTLDQALSQTMQDYYAKVFKRYDLRQKVYEFFQKYDALLTPTLPTEAFDAELDYAPGLATDDNIIEWIFYTYPFNLTGLPAASIPAGFTKSGLPVGLQIVGKHLGEALIFRLSAAFESARPWAHLTPPMKTAQKAA